MKKIIFLTVFIILNGCGSEEATRSSNNDTPSVKPSPKTSADTDKSKITTINSKESSKSKFDKNIDGINSSKYTIQLNQHKFITKSLILKANQSIYNMDINSFGVVKGSIVVISSVEPNGLKQYFDINKIAKETYQLLAKSSEQDLYYWYKKLSVDPQYSTVELEIDYSPKSDLQTY